MATIDDWRQLAACRGMDPNDFMPYQGREPGWQREAQRKAQEARAVCNRCVVKPACRRIVRTDTAVTSVGLPDNTKAHVGIFAGETYADRRKAIKERRDDK